MSSERDLTALDRDQCFQLLAAAQIGRVVFTQAAMPTIQPVTFVLDGQEIIFRTAHGAKLAAALRGAVAAFEVDEVDPHTRTGWSVVSVGRSYEITDPARLAVLAGAMPEPWVPDRNAHTIGIGTDIITGRRLSVPDGINRDLFTPTASVRWPGTATGRAVAWPTIGRTDSEAEGL